MANRKQNEEEVAVEAAESPAPEAASEKKAEPKQASLQEANQGFFAQMRAAMKERAKDPDAYRQKRRR